MGTDKPVIFLPALTPKKMAQMKEKHLKKYKDSIWAALPTWATIIITENVVYVVWHAGDEFCVDIDLKKNITELRGISVPLDERLDEHRNVTASAEFPTSSFKFSVRIEETQIVPQLRQIFGQNVFVI